MTRRRSLSALAASALIALALSGCAAIPFLAGAGQGGSSDTSSQSSRGSGESADAIEDTTWSGTDSDGDSWEITFQSGGGVAFRYNDGTFDDDSDTWSLAGSDLTITIVFDEGTAMMTGEFVDAATPIALDGQEGDAVWTLELQPS